ncbi:hypothetical protein NC652_029694 [Populus alba x Populus x berolinensis]|nr:hypothetical protein NC652_029694 [Populus alba x Populus x berolinensis]
MMYADHYFVAVKHLHPLAIKARGKKTKGRTEGTRQQRMTENLREKGREGKERSTREGGRKNKKIQKKTEAASFVYHDWSSSLAPPVAPLTLTTPPRSHCREAGTPLTGGNKKQSKKKASPKQRREEVVATFTTTITTTAIPPRTATNITVSSTIRVHRYR